MMSNSNIGSSPSSSRQYPVQPSFWSSSINTATTTSPKQPTPVSTSTTNNDNNLSSTPTSINTGVAQDGPFRSLIAQKERELHDINEYRLKSLEEAVRAREDSEKAIRVKFKKLKDDFVFNLRLIEERDRELDKYETTCDKLKTYVREREKDLANMKIEVTDYKTKINRNEEEKIRSEQQFQQQLKTMSSQLESQKWESEQIVQDYELKVHSLNARVEEILSERKSALESQENVFKNEARRISETAESRIRSIESTSKKKVKDIENRCVDLQKELKVINDKRNMVLHENDTLKEKVTANDAMIKKLNWDLNDVKLTKDREIQTLTKEKNELKVMKQSLLDEYENKMSELLQSLHAVEGAFVQQREQYELQLRQEASTREEELRRM